jgi:endonuclease YncB( thermonuclease family)
MTVMRVWIACSFLIAVGPGLAADTVIKDADTLRLEGSSYRLDGIDAPELDQTCLDESGAVWPCGIEARSRLAAFIDNRVVRCEDKGPDTVYGTRRIADRARRRRAAEDAGTAALPDEAAGIDRPYVVWSKN